MMMKGVIFTTSMFLLDRINTKTTEHPIAKECTVFDERTKLVCNNC